MFLYAINDFGKDDVGITVIVECPFNAEIVYGNESLTQRTTICRFVASSVAWYREKTLYNAIRNIKGITFIQISDFPTPGGPISNRPFP